MRVALEEDDGLVVTVVFSLGGQIFVALCDGVHDAAELAVGPVDPILVRLDVAVLVLVHCGRDASLCNLFACVGRSDTYK